ncbi:MAG: hypothetical protein KGJ78_04815 [Alphaproteobacteria bacterium]|nr:hypothetical protein [Alphaproteobacteria bacterium]
MRAALSALAIFSVAAVADLPPPADDYIGPRHTTLGGLAFEHRVQHYSRDLRLHRTDSYVLLVGCEGHSANCDRVTQEGVIDWKVVSAGGKPIALGDLQALIDAFAAAAPKITLLFVHDEKHHAPLHRAVTLDSR